MKLHSMEIGRTHTGQFEINRSSGSGDYLFLYVRCPARIVLKGVDQVFPEGSCIIFSPGEVQHYYSVTELYINDYFHFSLSQEASLEVPPFDLPLNQIIPMPKEGSIDTILSLLYAQYLSHSPRRELLIKGLMESLFLLIADISSVLREDASVSSYYTALKQLRNEIYQKPAGGWTVPGMAEKMQLSVSYFQKLYRDTFHISCYNDVIASKLHYAKILLSTTKHSVKVIALLCGYENDVHFMRQFKQVIGKTPSEYRASFLEC